MCVCFYSALSLLFALSCCNELKWKAFVGSQAAVSSLSLSLSRQGAGQEKLGIYIKSVVKGGAADVVSTRTQKVEPWWTIMGKNMHSDSFCDVWVCVQTGRSIGCRWPVVERGRAKSCRPVTGEVNTELQF